MDLKLIPVEFQSGVTVHVKPLSDLWLSHLRATAEKDKRHPKPQPPTMEIEIEDGQTVTETNAQDPDYIEALQAWEHDLNTRMAEYMLHYVVLPVDEETMHEQVREAAREQLDILGIGYNDDTDLFGDDGPFAGLSPVETWLTLVAGATSKEIMALPAYMIRAKTPISQEEVRQLAATFRSKVSGS